MAKFSDESRESCPLWLRVFVGWSSLGALAAAALVVFWGFDALPFQDLPAHAGLIAMRHRFDASPFEQRFFVFAPHLGPYSLFRFLGEVLVTPLGPVGSVRALASLPILATPLALIWARRRLHGDRSLAAGFYGLALGFGFMTLLGFASYLLGVAILLVALTVWLELMAEADRASPVANRWELASAAIASSLLLAHGYAFVVFLALAVVSTVATGNRYRRTVCLRALVPAVTLAGWAVWSERASSIPKGSASFAVTGLSPRFQGLGDKLSLLVTPTLITRTGVDIAVGLFLWAVVAIGVSFTANALRRATPDHDPADERSRGHSKALLVCLGALLAVFLGLPHAIGWFGFVDGRLVPLLLLGGILAIRRPALSRNVARVFELGAPPSAAAMIVIALFASERFQREAAGWRDVLRAVPADSRLLNLPIDPNSEVFTAHPFVHYDKLALAQRPMVVSDVWFHQGTALFPTSENPALRLPNTYSESDLRTIDWPSYNLADWDYVLVRTGPRAPAPEVPSVLALSRHVGGWWLFERRTRAF